MMEEEKVVKDADIKQCPGCGSGLVFDPESQNLKCESCGNIFELPKTHYNQKHSIYIDDDKSAYQKWIKEIKIVKCQTCGATVELNQLEISTSCPYCGSTYVLDAKEIKGLDPDFVIPFKMDKNGANQAFIKGVKKKIFVPSAFKKKVPHDKVRGIYIPSFSYDADTTSNYSGVLEIRKTVRDSKGNSKTVVSYKPISGTINENFKDILVEASAHLQDKDLNALLPYKFEEACDYYDGFLRGYSVEHYQDDKDECYSSAKIKMAAAIKRKIERRYSEGDVKDLSVSTNYFNELFCYRLVPVYCFEYNYKGKAYCTYLNGQTGKVGRGLPKSPLKISLFVLFIIAIIVALIVLYFSS